jgi:hypothetical protein
VPKRRVKTMVNFGPWAKAISAPEYTNDVGILKSTRLMTDQVETKHDRGRGTRHCDCGLCIGVKSLVSNDMVLEERLEIFLAVLAEQEGIELRA